MNRILFLFPFLAVILTAQEETPYGEFSEPNFPFHTCTLDLNHLGEQFPTPNEVPRAIVIKLGNNRHICWDTDLLRIAAWWEEGFVEMKGMASYSYHPVRAKKKVSPGTKKLPRIEGKPLLTTGIYPGWYAGEKPLLKDPRKRAPNPKENGLGALPLKMGRWNGLYRTQDKVVLSYEVGGIPIEENFDSGKDGRPNTLSRNIHIRKKTTTPLHLVIGEIPDLHSVRYDKTQKMTIVQHKENGSEVTAIGYISPTKTLKVHVQDKRYLLLTIPKGTPPTMLKLITWRGVLENLAGVHYLSTNNIPDLNTQQGGANLWEGFDIHKLPEPEKPDAASLATSIQVEKIPLPLPNQWKRNFRPVSVSTWKKGAHAVVTFDGDVWLMVQAQKRKEKQIKWKRYASGLHEPMSIESHDEKLLVYTRNGIIRLHDFNNDFEADYYENFSNHFAQTTETREYANSLEKLPNNKGFILVKGGIQANSRGIHNNHLLHISPDGKTATTYAHGLREGFAAAHPKSGLVYATDQQGNWTPTTPVHQVRKGTFLGFKSPNDKGTHPPTAEPFVWVPHASARSGTDILWAPKDFGPLSNEMILVDYHRPGLVQIFTDNSDPSKPQGASRLLPLRFDHPILKGTTDHEKNEMYLAGMQIFGAAAPKIGGITRITATEKPSLHPVDCRVTQQGILIEFNQPLDMTKATRANFKLQRWNYKRTQKYGSGHFKLDGKPGQEILFFDNVHLSPDGAQLFISIPKMKIVHTLEADFELTSLSGHTLKDKIWFTVHHLPEFDLQKNEFIQIPLRNSATRTTKGPLTPTVARGKELYTTLGCVACHSLDGTVAQKPGPTFKGIVGSERKLHDGKTQTADEAYLRESILQPNAKIVDGYQEAEVKMPPYQGILDRNQVDSLILFLQQQQ